MPAGPRVSATRRSLGPVAWCVLECLLAGVVEPVQERDPRGRFGPGRYRLITDVLAAAPHADTAPPTSPRPTTRRSRPAFAPRPELTMRTHVPVTARTDHHDRQVPAGGGGIPCCA
jgi:hypothetical protein